MISRVLNESFLKFMANRVKLQPNSLNYQMEMLKIPTIALTNTGDWEKCFVRMERGGIQQTDG